MITFNELSYRIFNTIKPKISDDESIDILDIQYDIENTRAMLIKQRYSNKFKTSISELLIQHIPKLEIENVNASNLYPDIPSDKVLMKTKLKVPNMIEKTSGVPLIQRISSSTILSKNFTFVTPQQAIYSGNGKFNQNNIFCFIEDGYIYLITKRLINKGIKYMDLYAVFARPTQVFTFLNTNNGTALDNNSPYPLNQDIEMELSSIIIKERIGIESKQPIDDVNDSSDTPKQLK